MSSIGLKGASGLGDSIYAVPIAEYFSRQYDTVHIMSNYPELFENLPKVKTYKHEKLNYIRANGDRIPIDKRFTYCGRKYTAGTSQFEDSYISIGIQDKLKLKIDWNVKNKDLAYNVLEQAGSKKICILSAPYEPFGRDDQWGQLLRISPAIMQQIVDHFKGEVYFIQVGNSYVLDKVKGVNIDLIGKTTVSDLIDLVSISDVGLSQIGNLLPICEALGKKSYTIFQNKAMTSDNKFIAAITPDKVVHYKHLNKSVIEGIHSDYTRDFYELLES